LSGSLPFYTYVLVSQTSGRRYIGHTDDLDRRLAEHNDPKHNLRKYTTLLVGPWQLLYNEVHDTRSEAMRREKWLKSGVGREWLDGKFPRETD
jgi:putative endonuclease